MTNPMYTSLTPDAAAIIQGFVDESSKQYWEGQFRYFSFTTFVELRWVAVLAVDCTTTCLHCCTCTMYMLPKVLSVSGADSCVSPVEYQKCSKS